MRGTAEVLAGHLELYGGLWEAEKDKDQGMNGDERSDFDGSSGGDVSNDHWADVVYGAPCRRIGAEQLREAASSFSMGTSCPDGLPCRAVALLSTALLEELADFAQLWPATGCWPASEAVVHTVLIPKDSGGERPVGLFRSIMRVLAKCKARQAEP